MIEKQPDLKYGFLGAVIWFLGMLGAAIQFSIGLSAETNASDFILIIFYFIIFATLFTFPMIITLRYYLKKGNFKVVHLIQLNLILFCYVGFLSSKFGDIDVSFMDRIMHHLIWVIFIVLFWNLSWLVEKRVAQK